MEHDLEEALDKIIQLAKQNHEFNRELRKRLQIAPSASSSSISDHKIDSIYEYCIQEIIKQHATEFYKDFPVKSIVPNLVEDFTRMEGFRRKDQFGDFCLAAYQQIECITNHLCQSRILSEITDRMWGYPAYVLNEIGKTPTIDKRLDKSEYSIAKLLMPKEPEKKYTQSLQTQNARDKMRIIVYFLGYGALMTSGDYNHFYEFSNSLSDLYQCRNLNHKGNTLTQWEQDIYNKILPLKSFYYFKFIGVLTQFVECVKNGYNNLDDVHDFAMTLIPKEVKSSGPKIIGKMDVSQYKKY